MSLLKRLEERAEFLLEELKIRAMHQKQAHGFVADDLNELISHLENHVEANAPVVVVATPASATVDVVEQVPVEQVPEVAVEQVPADLFAPTPVANPFTCVAPK